MHLYTKEQPKKGHLQLHTGNLFSFLFAQQYWQTQACLDEKKQQRLEERSNYRATHEFLGFSIPPTSEGYLMMSFNTNTVLVPVTFQYIVLNKQQWYIYYI